MELHIPNSPLRGRPTLKLALPWWAAAAERHAAGYQPDPDFPALYLAARVVDRWRADSELDPERPSAPYQALYDAWLPGGMETTAAAFVIGYLTRQPRAARLDDRTLTGLALAWAPYTISPNWPVWAGEVVPAASTERRPETASWAPWWRAAAIWPEAENMWMFACDLEYLWQKRAELGVRDHDFFGPKGWRRFEARMIDEKGWLISRSGRRTLVSPERVELPGLGPAEVLPAVLGPDPGGWPWPYDTWLLESGLLRPERGD